MKVDVAVVGGGMAGLTSAAYLCSYGYKVILCEQQQKVGGLVNSFQHKGFVLDGGIRAIENSGILFPMLKQLGIEVPFVKNQVSLMIEKERFLLKKENMIENYQSFMKGLFPGEEKAIQKLGQEIEKAMKYMKVLYGIDNPLFMNIKENVSYAFSLIPWLARYLATIGKIDSLTQPIDEYLLGFTTNNALVDMFTQHFFYKTPAFFALSYFSLYLDYQYPLGGTGTVAEKMEQYIQQNKGQVALNCTIQSVDCAKNTLIDQEGNTIEYKKMVWAADTNQLYNRLALAGLGEESVKAKLRRHKDMLATKNGSDSIFTVYLTLQMQPKELSTLMSPHVFYTPSRAGLSNKELKKQSQKTFSHNKIVGTKEDVFAWAKLYLEANTFEVSCPAMRDASLAPEGKAALIISCLFDYQITKQVEEKGYYEEFKSYCENTICDIIVQQLLEGRTQTILEHFSASPLTIQRYTGNTGGAVTGWGFDNTPLPAVTKMSKIASTIQTLVPNVYQAGQWTFAPSGLPIAVLTGKLAADKINKELLKK